MPAIFTPCTGVVEVLRPACADAFFTINITPAKGGKSEPINGIMTGASIEMSGNYQFLHTVNNFIYFYAFGDRIGVITLTGIGFVKPCPDTKKGALLKLYDYYTDNRAAVSGNRSMSLTISTGDSGTKTFRGFLTGMRMDIKSTDAIGTVGYWTFRFEVVPERKS